MEIFCTTEIGNPTTAGVKLVIMKNITSCSGDLKSYTFLVQALILLCALQTAEGYDPLDPNGNITIKWDVTDGPGMDTWQQLQCSTGSNIGTSHRLVGSSAGVGQRKRLYGPCLARRQYSRATALSTVPIRYLTVVHQRLLWSTCYPMSRTVCGSPTAVKVAYCKHSLKTQPKLWLFYKSQLEIRETPTKLWRCPIISPYYRQGLDTLVALLSTFRSPCFLLQTAEDGQKH